MQNKKNDKVLVFSVGEADIILLINYEAYYRTVGTNHPIPRSFAPAGLPCDDHTYIFFYSHSFVSMISENNKKGVPVDKQNRKHERLPRFNEDPHFRKFNLCYSVLYCTVMAGVVVPSSRGGLKYLFTVTKLPIILVNASFYASNVLQALFVCGASTECLFGCRFFHSPGGIGQYMWLVARLNRLSVSFHILRLDRLTTSLGELHEYTNDELGESSFIIHRHTGNKQFSIVP